jgi:hypothetical protein
VLLDILKRWHHGLEVRLSLNKGERLFINTERIGAVEHICSSS